MVSKIKGFGGPVWSVDFAQNSKYILCVSDSFPYPITIGRITGDYLDPMQYFYDFTKDDTSYIATVAWLYYEKFYSAQFTANDAAIRISTFSDSIHPQFRHSKRTHNKTIAYDYHRIMYSRNSLYSINPGNPWNKYLTGYGSVKKGSAADQVNIYNYSYGYVDVSEKFIANNISGNIFSILFYYDRLPIRKFMGIQPCFSPDGNYLLCIDKKVLKLYPAEERELVRLATEKSIFGNLEKNPGEWLHFFKDR
jgi:hypothetical protein